MRESDRPIELRVSVLDRPRAETDALPAHFGQLGGDRLDASSVRLALAVGDCRMYIGRGATEDELFQIFQEPFGGTGSAGLRSTLASHGALPAWGSGGDGRCLAHGIVADSVIAVRVDGVDAVVENNAFIAEVPSPGGEVILTTADGEREFPRPPSLHALRSVEESTSGPNDKGYLGMVEYAWSGFSDLEIDDLDSSSWLGTPAGVFLVDGNGPKVRQVGVVLLEGPRAGQLALADLVVEGARSGSEYSVEFVGRTPFGPHPEPPRLEAALQRLRKLGGRF